jgi:TPR repeat protein
MWSPLRCRGCLKHDSKLRQGGVAQGVAADQGLAEAQFSLGGMYANGHGVAQDYTEAGRWYRKVAD